MQRSIFFGIVISVFCLGAASAQQMGGYVMPVTPPMVVVAQPPAMQTDLGGGFIEYLLGGQSSAQPQLPPPPQAYAPPGAPAGYIGVVPAAFPAQPRALLPDGMDPQYLRREVEFGGKEAPGSIVIDTPNKFLYLVEPGGKAIRYGIGVGRPGFTWAGVHKVSAKKEWPDWVPPEEMLERQPNLPHFMAGGPNNPLGARALYLGSTLYRIHGSNEPWTIGHNVSSGCIRLRNEDVIDLYGRVSVGATVVVL
jgi:lipoprotein-anchoring transpeptidase ErfK/SrfK